MADKNLRVVITADDKDLQNKLKKSEKAIKNFNKGTDAAADAAKGFGKGVLQSSAGLGGLTAGAAAAGVAVAALAVKIGQAAVTAYRQYDKTLDALSYTTASATKVQEGFLAANLQTAASMSSVATASSVVWGRLGREVTDDTKRLVAQLGKWQDEAGFTGAALQDMGTIAQRFGMTKQLGTAFGYVKAAAQDTAFGIDEIAASMVSAAPLADHLGYSLGEFAKITNVLGKNGIGVGEWASIMERQLKKFSYNTEEAKKDWNTLVQSIRDPNYKGNKLSLLEEYGFVGSRALDMQAAINSGAFSGGTLASSALPSLQPGDWEEYLGLKWKAIEEKLYAVLDGLFRIFGPGGSFFTGDNTGGWNITDLNSTTTETIVPRTPPGQMPITTETGPWGFTGPSPIAVGATGGLSYDYKDPLVQMTADSEQATLKLTNNAEVVEARWRLGFQNIARSVDYNMGAVKGVTGDAAGQIGDGMTKAIYTLDTAFGQLQIDLTAVQEEFDEWGLGLSATKEFDKILEGAKRVGSELLTALGLADNIKEAKAKIEEFQGILQSMGLNLAQYWEWIVRGNKQTLDEINQDADKSLRLLAGDLISTMTEMFASGEWDWKKIWKRTWQGLLKIAVEYAIKLLTNQEAMAMAVVAIQTALNIAEGNWVKVALYAAAVATIVGTVAYAISQMKKDGEIEAPPDLGTSPYAAPSTISPYPSQAGTSSVVVIQNPTFIGQMDDRSAVAIGEGMAQAQSIRGAGTLAFA